MGLTDFFFCKLGTFLEVHANSRKSQRITSKLEPRDGGTVQILLNKLKLVGIPAILFGSWRHARTPFVLNANHSRLDGIRKGPGVSAPIQLVEQPNKAQSNDSNGHAKLKQPQKSMEFDLADAECLQRFLKIKVIDLL